MAIIKIQGSTKLQGKTIFDTGYNPSDSDAAAYIAAVEEADGSSLENGVKEAIDTFVAGCKSDSIWSDIKAACILAGARTLAGALVPLVGTAPTNNNFVSGDYNRETGLKGDGSTKYLSANRNNNLNPQNSSHYALYLTQKTTLFSTSYFGGDTGPGSSIFYVASSTAIIHRLNSNGNVNTASHQLGLMAMSRDNSANYTFRNNNTDYLITQSSSTPKSIWMNLYAAGNGGFKPNPRISFYSIGEAIDLSKLDSRVSTLMTDLAAAI